MYRFYGMHRVVALHAQSISCAYKRTSSIIICEQSTLFDRRSCRWRWQFAISIRNLVIGGSAATLIMAECKFVSDRNEYTIGADGKKERSKHWLFSENCLILRIWKFIFSEKSGIEKFVYLQKRSATLMFSGAFAHTTPLSMRTTLAGAKSVHYLHTL